MLLKKSKADKPILVIGDVILDIYHFGEVLADSEGVSVGREGNTRLSWGGAGLLVRNLLELKQKVVFISRLGDDQWSEYGTAWTHRNLTKCFMREKGRRTTVKERFVVGGKKVFKWNTLEDRALLAETEQRILFFAKKHMRLCRALIISDYRHGLLSKRLARQILALAQKMNIPTFVDSQVSQKEANHRWYKGADVFCLNETEAECVHENFSQETLRESLARLSDALASKYIIVKLSENGSVALIEHAVIQTPAHKVTVVDTCGAGDAFLAALASRGFPPSEESLAFANFWAGLSTTVVGAEPPKYKKYKHVRH